MKKWVHHFPFDAHVAEALARLYERRLERVDKDKDAAVYQRLEQKLNWFEAVPPRYSIDSFSQGE